MTDNEERFNQIADEMCELYAKKNHDYGNAFGETYAKLGPISAVTRISDKFNRLVTLMTSEAKVNESIEDTLIDLASYSIMTLMEVRKRGMNVTKLL